ncbi:hypothetical protein NZD89_27980 (plasmid) [Alicyclobacillus fastidiosus]|uniref:CobQ/CobB/MinD/ParA nucleotide binding domain-containing protein n=1 Tax=Alicyclobacillus fastidiosus TaxID=392011 RepID=A0ABY6ZPY8_9BACL|nr:hypothetical protein [Alicyclobacillus fastidiosus]WAH44889.1 hypothetical protein NZD89_27980 [Alicyclobacillus fastidiosus]
MLVLLIRNEAIYNRIVQNVDASHIAPYIPDFTGFQTWIVDNTRPTAALLDPQWQRVREAEQLLTRMGVPVADFTGQFAEAEAWLTEHISVMDNGVVEGLDEVNEPVDSQQDTTSQEPSVLEPTENEPVSRGIDTPSYFSNRVMEQHENPLLKRRRPKNLSEIAPKRDGVTEPESTKQVPEPTLEVTPTVEPEPVKPEPQIIERVIERLVEKPIYIREERHTTLRSSLILVVGIWPRAGASTIAQTLAHLFAERLPSGSVTCIEHPGQLPRMWGYFNLDERAQKYRHWLEDGVGQTIDVQGVSLVPLPPNHINLGGHEERLVEFVYRQMRRPITIVDCAQVTTEELLFSMADQIVCVLDCDPTFLSVSELGEKYQALVQKHGGKVLTVLNKWTRYVNYNDSGGAKLFAKAIKVPYLSPDIAQKALWDGAFISSYEETTEDLTPLNNHLVSPFVPDSLIEHEPRKALKIPFFKRRRSLE